MSKTKSAKVNYAIPGDVIDQQDFERMIREAENGAFHTIKAVKAELTKWKAKHSK